MNVVVSLEYRFVRTPDGAVWTQTMYGYEEFFEARYLHVFDQVRLVARIRDVDAVPAGWKRADGERVRVFAVPHYVGPFQYVRRAREIARTLRAAVGPRDAIILRVPSLIADRLSRTLEPGRPYALQVVGDPYDAFAPGAINHPLRALFRWWFCRALRRQCARAVAAAYVTCRALQRRYPCRGYTVAFSDVQVGADACVETPRSPGRHGGPLRLMTIGSLENLHKAPDVQIDAVAECVRRGLDVELALVGGGRHRPALESRAAARGVADRVRFVGQVRGGAAVRAHLDTADVYLQPSRAEGLPRALIEAMARALPCIGTAVGGIPELLAPEDLVPAGDAMALAGKIAEVALQPERLHQMSARNLARAGEFRDDVLQPRRIAFYEHVRAATERWLAGDSPCASGIEDLA